MEEKISNLNQVVSAYEVTFDSGKEKGISGVLCNNNGLEVFFNKTFALDISWLRYKGVNISYLSKNGLNTNVGSFAEKFEGGFLYTCGIDNVSSCIENKPVHGSFHYKKAENVFIYKDEEKIIVKGEIACTEFNGDNIKIVREYTVYKDKIVINDTVKNEGFVDGEYVLLYHTNFGYPFLCEELNLNIPSDKIVPLTEVANKNIKDVYKITKPLSVNPEQVFYHYLNKGEVYLENKKLNLGVLYTYSVKDFPVTLEWKSIKSGTYALGIEPSTTRFDEFKKQTIKSGQSKEYKLEIKIKSI